MLVTCPFVINRNILSGWFRAHLFISASVTSSLINIWREVNKENSLRPHGTRNRKPGTVVNFSASQDHMVPHSCISLWTGFLLSKAVNAFLPVILIWICWLLIYDFMFWMIISFDGSAYIFSLDSLVYIPIGWAWNRCIPSSNQLWPKTVRTYLLHMWPPMFKFADWACQPLSFTHYFSPQLSFVHNWIFLFWLKCLKF